MFQQAANDPLVDRIVFRHQDAQADAAPAWDWKRLASDTTLPGMSWLTTAWMALNSRVVLTGVRSTEA